MKSLRSEEEQLVTLHTWVEKKRCFQNNDNSIVKKFDHF